MKKRIKQIQILFIVLCSFLIITGCEKGSAPGTDDSSSPASIALTTNKDSIGSGGSESATLSVVVRDGNAGPVADTTVTFSSTLGTFPDGSTVTTGADGTATLSFTSPADGTMGTATITASATGAGSDSVDIAITGTHINMETTTSSLIIGTNNNTDTIAVSVLNNGNVGIADSEISVSLEPSGLATYTVSDSNNKTDSSGNINVVVTGTSAGTLTVTVSSLGVSSSVTYVIDVQGNIFAISDPADKTSTGTLGTPKSIVVDIPGVTSGTCVALSSSIGAWDEDGSGTINGTETGYSVHTVTAAEDTADKMTVSLLTSNTSPGSATVQIKVLSDCASLNGFGTEGDSRIIVFAAAASSAALISLQPEVSILGTSDGSDTNSTNIVATVKTAEYVPVKNALVQFTFVSGQTGGETLATPLVFTDSLGHASTQFLSGQSTTGFEGVVVQAEVVNSAATPNPTATTSVAVGGEAFSIALGGSTVISSGSDNTTYESPMSVIVTDCKGNVVPGKKISLSVWAVSYRTGVWVDPDVYMNGIETDAKIHTLSVPYGTTAFDYNYTTGWTFTGAIINKSVYPAEDINRNGWLDTGLFEDSIILADEDTNSNNELDAGEDTNGNGVLDWPAPGQGDGLLTPPNAAAGLVPNEVTTGDNGIGTFKHVFLKDYSQWVRVELTATTQVAGTEYRSTLTYWLSYLEGEEKLLSQSPWNNWENFPIGSEGSW